VSNHADSSDCNRSNGNPTTFVKEPCKASIKVLRIENIISVKRDTVIDRAKELLLSIVNAGADESRNILEEVAAVLNLDKEADYKGMTAGPNET